MLVACAVGGTVAGHAQFAASSPARHPVTPRPRSHGQASAVRIGVLRAPSPDQLGTFVSRLQRLLIVAASLYSLAEGDACKVWREGRSLIALTPEWRRLLGVA
jgi:hypothetical protein